ncbi:tRNA lysidine(34) synthetase TilS [Actinocrinis puniceicyclus]|uniref:tRNA(Ile)-lysidine synthase n=1 Tax=Actinocrinis puniceicyclus TaxID=977794 RepID=A0A8J7WK28_9ACTN|nr:tRNA lysidine(34) synthetase TilS [Actinocrinis puniceicyclus]MBS2962793.1 tRNA lysidine(34) synthetase TilS [Actinocrinis puniceicyclus]
MGPVPAVAAIRLAVRQTLKDHQPGDLVLVACSGGADSLALACAAAFVAPRMGLRCGAVTVDHGLQDGSGRRADEVVRLLRQRGLAPVESVAVVVGREGGPEAAARTARYQALDHCAERLDAKSVLLGHTRDDQAETVLLGLARGSGARSLAGMPARFGPGDRYRRPLLEKARSVTEEACMAEGVVPWRDPHNADPAYTRSRIRHWLLPAIHEALGPGMPEALARTARMLREDTEALDQWAASALEDCRHAQGGLDTARLAGLPTAVRRRVIRLAALGSGAPAGTLAAVHIEAVDALVTNWRGQGPLHLPGPVVVHRADGRLAFGERTLDGLDAVTTRSGQHPCAATPV